MGMVMVAGVVLVAPGAMFVGDLVHEIVIQQPAQYPVQSYPIVFVLPG